MHRRRTIRRSTLEALEQRRCCASVAFTIEDIDFGTVDIPITMELGDVDGDHDLDLVSASLLDGKIAWYENITGDGGFGPQRVVSTEIGNAYHTQLADIDGDSDLDIVAVGSWVMWSENRDGRGDYGALQLIAPVFDSYWVETGDMDGDGDLDVVFADRADDDVYWYENLDGRGAFRHGRNVVSSNDALVASLEAADIDGDGDLDVMTASHNRIKWHQNVSGKGVFVWKQTIDEAGFARLGDFDSDGDLDVAYETINQIIWRENTDGRGTFGEPNVIVTHTGNFRNLVAIDQDFDGDLDLVTGFQWLENDGSGEFTSHEIHDSRQPTGFVTVGDLDRDEDLDVVAIQSGRIQWYEAEGVEQFNGPREIVSRQPSTIRSIVAADLDGDGDQDGLATSSSAVSSFVGWFENLNSDGRFGTVKPISTSVIDARNAQAGDFDADGDLDVVVASNADNKIAWYENLGMNSAQLQFGEEQILSTESYGAVFVSPADIDGDGDLDIFAKSQNDDTVAWFENLDGLGGFGHRQVLTNEATSLSHFVIADGDGDGDLDVFLPEHAFGEVAWMENNNGNLAEPQRITAEIERFRLHGIELSDLDIDGDQDVVGITGNEIGWYENENGSYLPWQVLGSTSNTIDVFHLIDVEQDGDQDILVAAYNDGQLYLLENSENAGTFLEPRPILKSEESFAGDHNHVSYLNSGDFNDDGRADILAAGRQRAAWLENQTPAYVGDFDGNRILDVRDLDMLMAQIATGGTESFDLNGDGVVDTVDRDIWLAAAQVVPGDINFDGKVDAQDLNVLGRQWQQPAVGWSQGDLNGDQIVNAQDLNVVGQNWNRVRSSASIRSSLLRRRQR